VLRARPASGWQARLPEPAGAGFAGRSRRFALWLEDHRHQLGFGLAVLLRSLLHHGDRLTDLLGIGMFDGNEPGLLRIVDLGLVQHADDLCPPLDGSRRAQKADRVAAAVDS
jgi:hypothetical protein